MAGPGGGPGGPGGHFARFMTEEEKAAQPEVTAALLKRVFSWLAPYTPQLLLALACIALSSVFNLMPSLLTGRIIDEGILGRNLQALVFFIVLSFTVTLGANLIGVADEILVIKDGRIVERGQHKDLVKAGGVYTELYETQFAPDPEGKDREEADSEETDPQGAERKETAENASGV